MVQTVRKGLKALTGLLVLLVSRAQRAIPASVEKKAMLGLKAMRVSAARKAETAWMSRICSAQRVGGLSR
jgi:hypothetical protein